MSQASGLMRRTLSCMVRFVRQPPNTPRTAYMPRPPKPTRQVPGVYHLPCGDILVTALNDGTFGKGVDFFDYVTGPPKDQLVAMHRAAYRSVPPLIAVNAFLLHMADRLVLVDSGCGSIFGADLGLLSGNL